MRGARLSRLLVSFEMLFAYYRRHEGKSPCGTVRFDILGRAEGAWSKHDQY